LVTLPKNCWPRVLGSAVIRLYAGECTPSVDRALTVLHLSFFGVPFWIFFLHYVTYGIIARLERGHVPAGCPTWYWWPGRTKGTQKNRSGWSGMTDTQHIINGSYARRIVCWNFAKFQNALNAPHLSEELEIYLPTNLSTKQTNKTKQTFISKNRSLCTIKIRRFQLFNKKPGVRANIFKQCTSQKI